MTNPPRRIPPGSLREVWANTPKEYRSIGDDKVRRVLAYRNGGTQLVPLDCLTEPEIATRLNRARSRRRRQSTL
jgi:hypothetical protein